MTTIDVIKTGRKFKVFKRDPIVNRGEQLCGN